MDFKTDALMYLLGSAVAAFCIVQSLFFLVKAWRQGKKLGLSSRTMKNTAVSAALFTVAPAIAVLATVITLAGALGIVLPWIRLTVIGNISYEVTAVQSALEGFGVKSGLAVAIADREIFTAAAWVMTVGSVFPLVLLPLLLKRIQKKIGKVTGRDTKWADLMSAAAFIGLIAAFIARALAGAGDKNVAGDGAGVMSVLTLFAAVGFMLPLQKICDKYSIKWLEPFAMPASMILAMGVALLAAQLLPANFVVLEWRG